MTLPVPPINPSNPIPKSPFYYPQQESLSTGSGSALVVGSGLNVDYATGIISASGGGGGAVLSVSGTAPIVVSGATATPNVSVNTATNSSLGVVKVGQNIDVAAGEISVKFATTSQIGVVQLNDTLTSTSTLQALTANQGKNLQDQINSLVIASDIILAGTFNASTSEMVSVTTAGLTAGFVTGTNLPVPAVGLTNYYVIVEVGGSYNPPAGGGPYNTVPGDWFLCTGAAWQHLALGYTPNNASETQAGIVELATAGEVQTGVDNTRAVTPFGANSAYIPRAVLTAKGQLISSLGAGIPANVGAGADGQVLYACSAAPTGVTWGDASSDIPCSTIIGKGTIVTGTAANTPSGLALGSEGQYLSVNTACPSGLQWVSSIGVPCSAVTSKGALITGTAPGVIASLPPGPDGCILTTNSTCSSGLSWSSNTAIPCSLLAKGTLITGSTPSVPYALPVGTTGQYLVANSSCVAGMAWTTLPSYIPSSCIAAKGTLISGSGPDAPLALPVGSSGQFLQVNSACPTGLQWVTCQTIPCSCLNGSTGGLLVGCSSTFGVLSGGATGTILTADTTCALGVKWCAPAYIPCSLLSSKGQVVTATGSGAPAALPVGSDNLVLTACSACPTGLTWSASGGTYVCATCFTSEGQLIASTGSGTYSVVQKPARYGNGMPLVTNSNCTNGVSFCAVGQSCGTTMTDGSAFSFSDPTTSAYDIAVGWNGGTFGISSPAAMVIRVAGWDIAPFTSTGNTSAGGTFTQPIADSFAITYEFFVGQYDNILLEIANFYKITVMRVVALSTTGPIWVNITRLS